MAAATKYPAALVAVPVLVASLIDRPTLKNVRLWLTAGTALAIFALVTPFVWLDFGKFWADFSSMAQVHLLGPPHPKSMSSWSEILLINLRFGLGIMGLAALALSLASKRKLWQPPELVLLTAVVAFLWLLALSESTFMRYALPLAPLLAVQITRPLAGVRMKTAHVAARRMLRLNDR